MIAPRATYRLQLRAGFGFAAAARLAPYLAALGVSHVYLSPLFRARPGSPHGYDVVDHDTLNPDLGSEADYRAMIGAFDRANLKRLLDLVPNHMGVGGADNALWLDVLEWGDDSRFAGWFDIDWRAGGGKLLCPVLGAQYGEALSAGDLKLKFGDDGGLAIFAYDVHKLPLCPLTYPLALGGDPPLASAADPFNDLPHWRPQIAERAEALKCGLAKRARNDGAFAAALEARIRRVNDDSRAMAELIAAQRWRVAFFQVADDEINYRRFFNINDLAGLRVEMEAVFAHVHRRVFEMLKNGEVHGLRIDHIDGLFDPKAYLEALRAAKAPPSYLIVEKILASHEALRPDWPIEGTTGYDYLNLSLGLLIDPAGEAALDAAYRDFVHAKDDFATVARASKLRVMENEMASECAALARSAARLAATSPMTVDLTRRLLERAIKQVIAGLPIYRTYLDLADRPNELDRRAVVWALEIARREDPEVHTLAFDFLANILLGEIEKPPTQGISAIAARRFAMRLQQVSGPVMAKGVEDTAFYRYNRFVALNEVGGDPERFGVTPAEFHRATIARAKHWPNAMLATATHDVKRGEDARARLAVLSEAPELWRNAASAWSRLLRARLGDVEGRASPDRNDEYMLYQMLIGAWPLELLEAPSAEGLEAFGERLRGAVEKSLRESKLHSNWAAPNQEYEDAAHALVREALRADADGFHSIFLPFARRIARLGVDNSLAQIVLKLTGPGAPDIYQGCELWDFSLVDPDNRRPVDFAAREAALESIHADLRFGGDGFGRFEALLDSWPDGRIKLATTAVLLALRRDYEDVFSSGNYQPIVFAGGDADWAMGYVRSYGEREIATIVARFPAHREAKPKWEAVPQLAGRPWRDIFGRRYVEGPSLRSWLGPFPVSVLIA